MAPKFIHLHVHSEYSIVDSLVRIDALLQKCASLQMPAIAITDQNNFFGLIKFYKMALKFGIKPIVGVELWIKDENSSQKSNKILLLAQNNYGYKNLIHLITRSYLEGQNKDHPEISKEWMQERSDGIIALSCGQDGDIGKALLDSNFTRAEKLAAFWQKLFPNRFYLELTRIGKDKEEKYIKRALSLAKKSNLPVVATGDVRFINKEDFEAHEARVCIHEGKFLDDEKRAHIHTEEQFLRTEDEMLRLFEDLPQAIQNTVEIAKRCNVTINLGENFLPIFPLPNEETSIDNYFAKQAEAGLQKRFDTIFLEEKKTSKQYPKEAYLSRLKHEISVITQMGYPSYFLIVADFISWAKKNDVPVGPGRGSGAGSLVAYALEITDIDPLQHELLFERFLNPERISLPDFDVDFCMDGRDRVIAYVISRYGKERVAQIVTHGTMAAKAVVRDIGRVLGYPYGFVDKIAKLIPFTLNITLKDAIKQEELLKKRYEEDEEVKRLLDLALKVEGIVRNVGKHAGGVVIAPTILTDFTPLYAEPIESSSQDSLQNLSDNTLERVHITQFDKDDVEAIGLVKFDFLGLRTLTIIANAVKTINIKRAQKKELPINIDTIPLDDTKTFTMLRTCATTAVFQLESRGMKDLIKRLKPDSFNDIVALVALFRPGPLQSGMVDDFIDRKYGRAQVSYFHPLLEPILKPTYGVILYQEQVMQIAQVLSGYSLGSADILRSAMGKKKPEEMAKQRAIFIDGAVKQNIDKHIANTIFDLMEKFAGYGFNKSHSVAYALLAYRTAFLKTHYPAEFMATVLSLDMDNTDKVVKLVSECKSMGLNILPPDINSSFYTFTVSSDSCDSNQNEKGGEIIFGLGAIKGAGENAIENIIAAREKNGPLKSLFELCEQTDKRKVNRRVLEALIKSGSLDKIGPSRESIFASLENAMATAEKKAKSKHAGQISLFDNNDSNQKEEELPYLAASPWAFEERLTYEKSTLGFYLSGHPIERFLPELNKFVSLSLAELVSALQKTVLVAGIIANVRTLTTKNNKQLAIITLEDKEGSAEITCFSELYKSQRELIVKDQLVIIEGDVDMDDFSGNARVRAKTILKLEEARAKYAALIALKPEKNTFNDEKILLLKKILKDFLGGKTHILLDYNDARILLGDEWNVNPKDELLTKLKDFFGDKSVEVKYKK